MFFLQTIPLFYSYHVQRYATKKNSLKSFFFDTISIYFCEKSFKNYKTI